MLYFLLIMVIFLLAYGVAQQAILHPNEEPSWSVVSGVFFRPYFQVYGELFVETPDTSKHGLFSLTTQACENSCSAHSLIQHQEIGLVLK